MRERDLASDDRIVAGHIGLRVMAPVLVFDIHAGTKLLEVEPVPIDSDRVSHAPSFITACSLRLGHLVNSPNAARTRRQAAKATIRLSITICIRTLLSSSA